MPHLKPGKFVTLRFPIQPHRRDAPLERRFPLDNLFIQMTAQGRLTHTALTVKQTDKRLRRLRFRFRSQAFRQLGKRRHRSRQPRADQLVQNFTKFLLFFRPREEDVTRRVCHKLCLVVVQYRCSLPASSSRRLISILGEPIPQRPTVFYTGRRFQFPSSPNRPDPMALQSLVRTLSRSPLTEELLAKLDKPCLTVITLSA